MSDNFGVLPRPGTNPTTTPQPLSAPSEASFVETFGQLLPPASYLQTEYGKAAYYEFPPSASPSNTAPISRVLLVHGVQTPAIGLQPLAKILSTRFPHAHIVLVDLWGHGLTDTPLLAHEASLFHQLIESLMAHLSWKNAHFIGYSFGASTTASFVAIKPERVTSIALVAPAGFISTAEFTEEQRAYLRGGEGLEEKAKAWVLEFLEGGNLIVPGDWKERVSRGEVVAEAVKDWQWKNHPGHAASVVAIFRDGGPLDNEESFVKAAKAGRKCQVILGEKDGLSSEKNFMDVGMQNIAVVPGAGHAVVRSNPGEVADVIEGFWKTF